MSIMHECKVCHQEKSDVRWREWPHYGPRCDDCQVPAINADADDAEDWRFEKEAK